MVVCVTGPVLGVIVGGAIVQNYFGGYEGKHASTFAVVFAGLALLSTVPIRQIDNIYTFGVCLWAVLFFGGGTIPSIQGIMISSLSTDLRASGSSFSNLMQNAFGYLPAPFIYGIIYKHSKNFDQKLAFALTLWYSGVGLLLFGLSMYFRFKKFSLYLFTETVNSEVEVKVVDNNNVAIKLNNKIECISKTKIISTTNVVETEKNNKLENYDIEKNEDNTVNYNKKLSFYTENSNQNQSKVLYTDKDFSKDLSISITDFKK